MKLSINGRFRKAAQAAFVGGLAAASFSIAAQEPIPAPVAAEPAPAPVAAEPAAAPMAAEPAPAPVAAEPAPAAPVAEASIPVAALAAPEPAVINDEKSVKLEKVRVTGSRIVIPGATSASPIVTVRAEEFALQQTPEVEQVLRNLPSTLASDGSSSNNGTAGVSTLNLRGLGDSRTLILVDGKRLTPYDVNGIVDLSIIPTALLDRVDLVTGGASAVYGSDAMAGAANFIMKRNFNGIDIDYVNGITEEGDGDKTAIQVALGTNLAEGKGNVSMALTYAHRDGVQLGQRPLGQLGIVTEDGSGFAEFQAGQGPEAAPGDCNGTGTVAVGGSPSTLPARIGIAGASPAADTAQADPSNGQGSGGTPTSNGGQFRNNGDLGNNCNVFNFNPFNYYETPQDRYGGAVFGRFEFNEHAEAYSRFLYSNTRVRQQIAPSGVFGTAFFVPLANPFFSDQARTLLIAQGNNARTTGSLPAGSWRDINGNMVVDRPDELRLNIRRRTTEFGERSTTFENSSYQFALGSRGTIIGDWDYDVSYQRGQSDQLRVNAGYTNITNIGNALRTTDGVTCENGDPSCVPINLFSGEGTITPAMASYSSATALERRRYEQSIANATVVGSFDIDRPFANRPIGLSFGAEKRREEGETTPDECLKLAPVSCLGGAGGNTLPIVGGFQVTEFYTETIIPLLDDKVASKALDLELGYRWADYTPNGLNKTWKYGLSWTPVDSLLVRVMRQRAARAPNVGELAAPQTTGLDNAQFDPCSTGNPAPLTPAQVAKCEQTGVAPGQAGTVADIAAGQINGFFGTDLEDLPGPEKADSTTLGIVFSPKNLGFIRNAYLSLDYYDIEINNYIDNFGAQEVLDGCYTQFDDFACDKIRRVDGTLGVDGSGVELFTTNLRFRRAEGLELASSFDVPLTEQLGKLKFGLNANYFLTQETKSSDANETIDCKGRYGTQCGNPLPDLRFVQRTTWQVKGFDASYFWRYIGSTKIESAQVANVFQDFRKIDAYSYIDLSLGYTYAKAYKLSFLVTNVLEKDPPVVGNEAADTRSNSGNTFPAVYDVLGRTYSFNIGLTF